MPTYEYIALDSRGKQSRGSIAAESPTAARRQLRNRKLHATRLRPVSELAHSGYAAGFLTGSRRRRQVLEFTRQLQTMIQADVQLTEALGVLISQSGSGKFGQVLQNIRDQVLAGESFADGIKQYPQWFDNIFVSMVRVGEATGNLDRSLQLLAEYMSKKQRLEAKVKSALTYPAILVVICILVTIILMTVVVPKVTKIIKNSGRELPQITVTMMNISQFLIDFWWVVLLAVGFLYWLFRRTLAQPKGRMIYDRYILRIPVVGELLRQSIVARFTSTLAALIRSGMPMAESLKVVAGVAGNAVMAQAIRTACERIIAGADVATPLRNSQVVGPAVAHMISVGEKTGELERMLLNIADGLEESTDITVQRMSSVVEPVIIVFMAVIVGTIMIATMLPILQVADLSKI